jgi:DEAD/DEAH box helicase domain-containing protein
MINKEIVVEFMTNAGLLPNYAFPETGVKLTATIFSKKALGDEAGNTPEPTTLELVRPASQGIRELAPDNKFYTQKLKLPINGLSLKDRADSVKMLRYCSDAVCANP